MNKKAIKFALVSTGIVSLLGWFVVGETIMGSMMFTYSIVIGLVAHFMTIESKIITAPITTAPKVVVTPVKSAKEIEREELLKKLKELDGDTPLPPPPSPPEKFKVKKKGVDCPLCELNCKSEHHLNMHLLTKHKDQAKIKLDIVE